MYFKKIFMDKRGSLSYLIGCPKTRTACVIDPSKADVQKYIEAAEKLQLEITHIFDTSSLANHLNGITELKLRTGADVYYLRNSEDIFSHFHAKEGDIFDFGHARIEIINSPRHDPYGNSIRVTDKFSADSPWMILKKESLFIGNIGNPEEGGAKLSDEIFNFLECNGDAYDQTASASSDFDRYPGFKRSTEYAAHPMG